MNTIVTNHEYRIDLDRCPLLVELDQPLSHQDALADRFTAILRRGMTPADLTGMHVLAFMTFESLRQTLPLEGSISGNAASVTLTSDCYAVPGPFSLVLQLVDGDARNTVLRLRGCIARSTEDTLISSGELLPPLPELLEDISDMRAATDASREATAQSIEAMEANNRVVNEFRSLLLDITAEHSKTAPPIIAAAEGDCIFTEDAAPEHALLGLNLKGVTTQSGTPSPDAPAALDSAGDNEAIQLMLLGRNLFDPSNTKTSSSASSQCTFTVSEDGWIDVTSQNKYEYLFNTRYFSAGFTYTLRFEVEVYGRPEGSTSATKIVVSMGDLKSKTITANGSYTYLLNYTPAASGYYSVLTHANYGSAEPAKVKFRVTCVIGRYTANTMPAWSPFSAQTFSLPYALRGVPVASGGNLTDASGQRWITDEIDFSRGVYVQRIKKITVDGSSNWVTRVAERSCYSVTLADKPEAMDINEYSHALCNRLTTGTYSSVLAYGTDNTIAVRDPGIQINIGDAYNTLELAKAWLNEHPLEIVYALAEPIETPLDPQLLADYVSVRITPDTTLTADGTHLQASYVADTKAYIDLKFTQLANALINT